MTFSLTYPARGMFTGFIWGLSALAGLLVWFPPTAPLGPLLLTHLLCGISTAGLALCLGRSAGLWLVASLLVPFLPALWLTRRPPAGTEALSACDTCWYSMERDINPMVVVGFMFMRQAPKYDTLARVLEERLLCFDRFRQVPRDVVGHLYWTPAEDFDLAAHLHEEILPECTEAAFNQRLDALTGEHLDFNRPLWDLRIFSNHPRGAVVVIRIHHCLADGIALVRVLLSLTDGMEPTASGDATKVGAQNGPAGQPDTSRAPRHSKRPGFARLGLELLQAFPRLLMLPDGRTCFKNPLSGRRRTAWSLPIPVATLKEVARLNGCKINDVILATTAGAIRRYLVANGDTVKGLTFRVLVPVNLRRLDGPIELGNKVGFIYLPLPVGEEDRLQRLTTVKATMDRVKSGKEALLSYWSMCLIGTLPKRLQQSITDILNQNASATMTNVPGPREAITLAGQAITDMGFMGPQSGQMGVGISAFSYNGRLTLGINADAGMIAEPQQLSTCFEEEVTAWLDGLKGQDGLSPQCPPPAIV
jgi:diacylglycerol O-acyltransferase